MNQAKNLELVHDVPTPPLDIINASEWAGKVPPEPLWTLEGWLPYGSTSLLYGDGGVGKSLLALTLSTCLVAGLPFMGIAAYRQKVLYISCEDDYGELQRRIRDVCKAYSIDESMLHNLLLYSGVGEDNILFQTEGDKPPKLTELFHRISDVVASNHPNLVIIDTAADTFAGNEVSRKDVRMFMTQCLGKLAKTHDCSVLLLAHPSQSGIQKGFGYSGSTAWNNSARSRLYFDFCRDDNNNITDKNLRVLRLMKSNYGKIGQEIRLRYQSGAFVQETLLAGTQKETADETFVFLMRKLLHSGRTLSTSRNATNYAPKLFSKDASSRGYKKHEFEKAMERLIDNGTVMIAYSGKNERKAQRLVFSDDICDDGM